MRFNAISDYERMSGIDSLNVACEEFGMKINVGKKIPEIGTVAPIFDAFHPNRCRFTRVIVMTDRQTLLFRGFNG